MGRFALAHLLLIGWLSCSCTDAPAAQDGPAAHRVSAASSADATAEVVGEAEGYRLAWPGPGWKMLSRNEARKLVPDAMAGALADRGIAAVLLIEPALGRTLGDAVAQLLARLSLRDVEVEHNEAVEHGTKQGRRFVLRGIAEGVSVRYAGWVQLHQGSLYQLIGWGPESAAAADGRWLDPLVEALSLQGGPVAPERAPAPVDDCVGPGFRVVDGVLESAVAGLRLTPPAGYRLLIGPELALLDPDAVAGLVRRDPDVLVHLRTAPVPAPLRVGLLDRLARQVEEDRKLPQPPDRVKASMAGESLELFRYTTEGQVVQRGVSLRADRGLFVTVRHDAAAGPPAEVAAAALSGFELLAQAQAEELVTTLSDTASAQSAVGSDFALRGGTYRDFRWRLSWSKPEGFWLLAPGAAARRVQRDASLYVYQPRLGLHGLLIVEAAGGVEQGDYHRQVTERMASLIGYGPGPAEPFAIDDVEGSVSEGDAGAVGRRLRYRVVTTVHDERAIQVLVWSYPELLAAHREQAIAAAKGLTLQAVPPAVEVRGGVYRDVRMGFELQPPTGWAHADLTPAALQPRGTFVRWSRDGRWLAVLAVDLVAVGGDQDWFVGLLEQLLRSEMGALSRGEERRADETVAARPARHLRWSAALQQVDAVVLRRGSTAFALLSVDAGSEAFDLITRRFVVLR